MAFKVKDHGEIGFDYYHPESPLTLRLRPDKILEAEDGSVYLFPREWYTISLSYKFGDAVELTRWESDNNEEALERMRKIADVLFAEHW